MKQQRINDLEKYLLRHEIASLDELCNFFDVSINTIRRDINDLESKGVIKKIYGGVTINKKSEDTIPYSARKIKNQSEKLLIGELASKLVEEGDNIFIDSGTTTLQMLPHLKDLNITILTNNLNFMIDAIPYPALTVISTGGKMHRTTNSFIGEQAVESIKSFNIQKAFMAATGISISKGCTNSSSLENQIKCTIVNQSEKIYLLADHTKYDTVSLMTFCNLNDIYALITDCTPPKEYIKYFKENNVEFLYK